MIKHECGGTILFAKPSGNRSWVCKTNTTVRSAINLAELRNLKDLSSLSIRKRRRERWYLPVKNGRDRKGLQSFSPLPIFLSLVFVILKCPEIWRQHSVEDRDKSKIVIQKKIILMASSHRRVGTEETSNREMIPVRFIIIWAIYLDRLRIQKLCFN